MNESCREGALNDPTLAAGAHGPLQAVLQELRRDRGLTLLVKAFADSRECDASALSTERAELVVSWLEARGEEQKRLVAKGCGSKRPLNFGSTPADRARNRGVELVRLTSVAGCEPPR